MNYAFGVPVRNLLETFAQDIRRKKKTVATQVVIERPVDGAGNVAGHAVDRFNVPSVTLSAARVHQAQIMRAVHRRQYVVCLQGYCQRRTAREPDWLHSDDCVIHGKSVRLPALPAAIEHRNRLVSQPAQQPPQSRSYRAAARVVRNHLRIRSDTPLPQPGNQLIRIRQGMPPGVGPHGRGKIAVKMCVDGSRNVRLPPGKLAGIGTRKVKPAVDNSHTGFAQVFVQGLGSDQCSKHDVHLRCDARASFIPSMLSDFEDKHMANGTGSLKGKTVFITGGSRGIGLEIARRCAVDGANVAIAAKTAKPHPKLPGTIYTAAEEIEAAGGKALPLQVDIREEQEIAAAMKKTAQEFGGIDVLINNASAINLTPTTETPMRRFDLMFGVNVRGTFAASQAAFPYLTESGNPHILTLSPPLNMDPKWFKQHVAYTMSKYGMSMCVLGMAEEFRDAGIAVNGLWPKTVIATAALAMLGGLVKPENCRKPDIMADAAHAVLLKPSREATGNFFIDEDVLREAGVNEFDQYAVEPGKPLAPDLFLG